MLPKGEAVLTGGFDGIIKVWELASGQLLYPLLKHEGDITDLNIHPNDSLVASCCGSGETLQQLQQRQHGPHELLHEYSRSSRETNSSTSSSISIRLCVLFVLWFVCLSKVLLFVFLVGFVCDYCWSAVCLLVLFALR